jgi:hypothetical protein
MDFASLAEKFGFPVLCVIACGWFIRWLVMDRIKALEHAIKASIARETIAQEERIKAADRFASAMKDMAEKTTRALERNTTVAEKNQEVLGRLLDHLAARPCLAGEPRPQSFQQPAVAAIELRTPSSAELPAVEPPTDRHDPQDNRWRKTK